MQIQKPQHPKRVGEVTESIIITVLLSLGFNSSKPYGDNCPYDLLVDFNGKIKKVQIKTGKLKKDSIKFNTARNRLNTKGSYRTIYNETEVDLFLVYCYETEEVYIIPNKNLPKCSMVLTLKKRTKTNHPIEDYLINKYVSALKET